MATAEQSQTRDAPSGVAPPPKAFGANRHKGRNIEASRLANADDMRARVIRKRYPYTIAVIGPQGSGKSSLVAALAACMGAGVPDDCLPTGTGTGLNTTVVYTRHMSLALIDTPGDPACRRDVITALAQADAALLVVSSEPTEWKNASGTEEWQEYVKLARAMDMDNGLFTVINKIDLAGDNQNTALSRFMRCRMPILRYFESTLRGKQPGSRQKTWPSKLAKNRVFCASAANSNGVSGPFKGPANIETLMLKLGTSLKRFLNGFGDTGFALNKEVRQGWIDKLKKQPLRILIDDVFYNEAGGWVAVGKVASGSIEVGQEVTIAPGGVRTTCKEIKFQNADPGAPNFSATRAVAGERVEIAIGEAGLSANMIFAGSVMGRVSQGVDAPETVTEVEALVSILKDAKFSIDVKQLAVGALFRGEETTEQPMDFALGSYPAYFDKIVAIVNPNTGRVIKEGAESVGPGQTARVTVRLSGEGIPLDIYEQYQDTGRFLVRGDNGQGRLVAVGKVTSKDWM